MKKKKGNSTKKCEFVSKVNKKTFAKKPQNGGTPAIEKRDIINVALYN